MEAAIIVPVLALLGFGAADGAWLFVQTHRLEAGLTAGGSYLAQTRAAAADEQRARNVAVFGEFAPGGSPRIPGWRAADVSIAYRTVANTSGQYRNAGDVRVARLESTLPYRGLGVLSGLRGEPVALSASFETRITP